LVDKECGNSEEDLCASRGNTLYSSGSSYQNGLVPLERASAQITRPSFLNSIKRKKADLCNTGSHSPEVILNIENENGKFYGSLKVKNRQRQFLVTNDGLQENNVADRQLSPARPCFPKGVGGEVTTQHNVSEANQGVESFGVRTPELGSATLKSMRH